MADHFNSAGHSVDDMKVSGLYRASNMISRRLMEQRIIGILGCILGRGGMNVDFRFNSLLNDRI